MMRGAGETPIARLVPLAGPSLHVSGGRYDDGPIAALSGRPCARRRPSENSGGSRAEDQLLTKAGAEQPKSLYSASGYSLSADDKAANARSSAAHLGRALCEALTVGAEIR